jgi:hypothetical protein
MASPGGHEQDNDESATPNPLRVSNGRENPTNNQRRQGGGPEIVPDFDDFAWRSSRFRALGLKV